MLKIIIQKVGGVTIIQVITQTHMIMEVRYQHETLTFFYRKFEVYAKIYGNMLMKLIPFLQPPRIKLYLLKMDLRAYFSS